jgi:flagellar motor switch protein FliN/FliY
MTSDTPEAAAQTGNVPETTRDEGYAPDELKNGATRERSAGADVNLDLVLDVPVNVSLRVGSTEMAIKDLVRLVEGSVIALDRESSEPMDVLVNGRLIAHGEIVLVDNRFGVRLTDVVSAVERIEKLT